MAFDVWPKKMKSSFDDDFIKNQKWELFSLLFNQLQRLGTDGAFHSYDINPIGQFVRWQINLRSIIEITLPMNLSRYISNGYRYIFLLPA
jgi:hypothetical protein